MRYSTRIFTCALFTGILVGVVSAPLLAQTQHTDHETLKNNEEAVKKLLEESDPDVAFLARIEMMEGHLNAAIYAVGIGDLVEARQHIIHPMSEILPDIVSVLEKRHVEDPSPALRVILDYLESGTKEQTESALYDSLADMAALEHSIDRSKLVNNRIVADTAVLLLRTAVMEYAAAYK